MTKEEITEYLTQDYLSERDNRVQKPEIWINELEPRDYIIWSNNWILTSNNTHIRIDKPNDIALYSKIAIDNLKASQLFYEEKIVDLIKKVTINTIYLDEQKLYYDYYEKIITSIIFACTALEALANIFIPDDYEEQKQHKDGTIKIISKSEIERNYTLKEKFKTVLKNALKTTDPSKEKWWNNFLMLADIRNEIIHTKPSKSEERYSFLLNPKVFEIVASHIDIIQHYGKFISRHNDLYLINQFPYGFGYDKTMFYEVEDSELLEIRKEIGNVNFNQ